MDVSSVLAFCRFARNGTAMTLWGSSFYVAVVVPRELRSQLRARYAWPRRASFAALAAAILALLPIQVASLGDGWPDAFDPSTTRALLFETTIGTAWFTQAATTVALLLVPALPWEGRDRTTALFSGLLLASLTLSGHAAMHEAGLGMAHRANDIIHLLAAGFWLGALVPLLPTLSIMREPNHRGAAALALRRFSTLGHGAVILVILTGIANTALVLGRWPTDWTSAYQRLLAAKIVLVTAMTALAVINRYVFVPRISGDPFSATHRIRQATWAEVAIGFGAVALVAIFGQLEPV